MEKETEPAVRARMAKASRVRTKAKARLSYIITLLSAVLIALFLRLFIIETIQVIGPSMEPTLYTDERLLVDKITYQFREPRRNEVVIASFVGRSDHFVKRVVGLPGDVVEIRNGLVYLNGVLWQEDSHRNGLRPYDMAPVTVPEDYVFLMGDHRDDSTDSCDLGPVPLENVRGRGVFIIWPMDKFGRI